MKKTTTLFLIFSIGFFFFSCSKKQGKVSYDEIGASGNTTRTENLANNLPAFLSKGVMVGQIYGTLQGVGWTGDSARSDMRSICGVGPACVGYELAGIENGADINIDSLSFDAIRKDILYNFNKGGLITATWSVEPTNDEELLKSQTKALADYLSSLQDDYGIKAPVVLYLYPYQENTAVASLSADDYKTLYHKTKELLKQAEVTNVVYGFSTTSSQVVDCIPAEDVQVIEYRLLQAGEGFDVEQYKETLHTSIEALQAFAQEHAKTVGLTTGVMGLPYPKMFTEVLKPLVEECPLSYMMFGPNRGNKETAKFCIPYPGWNNEAIADFSTFQNSKKAISVNKLNGLYLTHNQ